MKDVFKVIAFIEGQAITGRKSKGSVFIDINYLLQDTKVKNDEFEELLNGLVEKYSSDFYGFYFYHDKTYIGFRAKK